MTRLVLQALDDIAAPADRARRDPDPVEEVRERIDALLVELRAIVALGGELLVQTRELADVTRSVDRLAADMVPRGDALIAVSERLERSAQQVLTAERALVQRSRAVDAQTRALLAGGRRLTELGERIEGSLGVFRAEMPRLLQGVDTVDELEGAVETVAETVEPLQGAAERVGRASDRLSRRRS